VRSEGFYVNEKSGIEPATFRFVAQHLNHCATAVPDRSCRGNENNLQSEERDVCEIMWGNIVASERPQMTI